MRDASLRALLEAVRTGEVGVDTAVERLGVDRAGMLAYATLDLDRERRTGIPEVVYGAGKPAERVAGILRELRAQGRPALATRVDAAKADAVLALLGPEEATYHAVAEVLECRPDEPAARLGRIGVVCAGTSDLRVAEEAAVIAEALGHHVERFVDVGVAGLHRILRCLPELRACRAIVVVAGMDGALPGVLAGLVDVPIVAVPTSVGYGAGAGGVAAMLTMLNACAPGVTVVNIDNGFGGAVAAARINRLAAG